MKYTINKILVTLSISTIATGDLMVIMRGVGEIFWTLGPRTVPKKGIRKPFDVILTLYNGIFKI